MTTAILFQAGFESGAMLYRNGQRVYRVSPCTHWDDECERVVVRDGIAVTQLERREYSGHRPFSTDEWSDYRNLGPVEGLEIVEDCPRGCQCESCY